MGDGTELYNSVSTQSKQPLNPQIHQKLPTPYGVFGLRLFLLKLKTETENTVAK